VKSNGWLLVIGVARLSRRIDEIRAQAIAQSLGVKLVDDR